VFPLLTLAQRLRARGHEAVLCAPPDFETAALERGVEFRPIGLSVHEIMRRYASEVSRGGVRLLRATRELGGAMIARQFEQLPDATRGADLVIGAGVQFAAPSAAEIHGVPYRYVAYCPTVIPSNDHPPVILPTASPPRWVNRTLWRALGLGLRWGMRPAINRQRNACGLGPVRDLLSHVLSEHPVLAADPELGPRPANCPLPLDQIPCLHPFEPEPLPAKLDAFLSAGPRPVYLGFGSMTDPNPASTTRVVLETVARLGCRALISEGWAGLGRGPLPEGVMTVGAVSHPALFRRVAVVVHHGGAGTTTTAARAGTPQIVVPHLLDQHYWAHRVQLLGVAAPPLRRSRLDAKRLAETLSATLDNEQLAERAAELGEHLRRRAGADPTGAFLSHGIASGSPTPPGSIDQRRLISSGLGDTAAQCRSESSGASRRPI
jgi:UDP:flavonoid glycosyltransferase YjiC (YdhE family)